MQWWIGCCALALVAACAPRASVETARESSADARGELLAYLKDRNTTGFLVVQRGETIVEAAFPPPAGDRTFAAFVYGAAGDGALLEDVASQQKSLVGVLFAIAIDKGLVDPDRSVSAYLGPGWSKAPPAQEAAISVAHILTMTSGLDEGFVRVTEPGARFFYNTPVYAITKQILVKASGRPLGELTRTWLTGPLGMTDTTWRQRPAALANVGNATALVTTPRDLARLGAMILRDGRAENGARIVSRGELAKLFAPSSANHAYGRLWWRNGGAFAIGASGARREGPLIRGAPADLVAALGFFDRRLFVVPSLDLVVVRTGAATVAPDFDEQLWARLKPVLPP